MDLVVISGGTSDPSSTRMLADRLAAATVRRASDRGLALRTRVIELRPLAASLASSQVTGFPTEEVAEAVEVLAAADGLIVATPVYSAGVSGLVKTFFDVVDPDLLIAVPTVLAATAGTARHALVADEQLRSLLAYLRALTTPTSVFAAGEDWGTTALAERIERAANELVVLLAAGVKDAMRDSGRGYSRVFGGASEAPIELDGELMRLATGG